jgi:hypothetical protein
MRAPIALHLDLYAYWQDKRGSRSMPARNEINPADIPQLLPYLAIMERAGDQFRTRLMGSALVTALGQDPTGTHVGHSLSDPSAAEVRAIFECVFKTGHPVFATGEFVLKSSGATRALSMLVLPLSDDGERVNMSISSLVARFHVWRPSRGWLKDVPAKVCGMIEVENAEGLENLCLAWEQRCREEPAA